MEKTRLRRTGLMVSRSGFGAALKRRILYLTPGPGYFPAQNLTYNIMEFRYFQREFLGFFA